MDTEEIKTTSCEGANIATSEDAMPENVKVTVSDETKTTASEEDETTMPESAKTTESEEGKTTKSEEAKTTESEEGKTTKSEEAKTAEDATTTASDEAKTTTSDEVPKDKGKKKRTTKNKRKMKTSRHDANIVAKQSIEQQEENDLDLGTKEENSTNVPMAEETEEFRGGCGNVPIVIACVLMGFALLGVAIYLLYVYYPDGSEMQVLPTQERGNTTSAPGISSPLD